MIARLNNRRRISLNGGGVSDADAQLYLTNSGITDAAIKNEVNNLFIALKNASLYTKIKAGWLHVGDGQSKHKLNIKNPLDTDAAFRLTNLINGVNDVNGSTSVADTHFVMGNELSISSCGITVASGAGTGGSKIIYGAIDNVNSGRFTLLMTTGSVLAFRITTQRTASNTDNIGVYTSQKINATIGNVWKNGTKIIADDSYSGVLPENFSNYLNAANNSGSIAFQDNKRLQTCLFHEGLTDAEVSTLHTIIDNFETALGRKTW